MQSIEQMTSDLVDRSMNVTRNKWAFRPVIFVKQLVRQSRRVEMKADSECSAWVDPIYLRCTKAVAIHALASFEEDALYLCCLDDHNVLLLAGASATDDGSDGSGF